MKKKIIILGGIGNGSVIAAAMLDANKRGYQEHEFVGYLNDRYNKNELIEGMPILGKLSEAKRFANDGYYVVNTIYRIDGQQERIDLFESLNIPESMLATFVHPSAYVAPQVKLGAGCVVMPNASVSPGCSFGKCCLVMANASVGHNTTVGDYCHFAAQSCTSSFVHVNNGVHVGLNATIRENITLGTNSALGMGAVLINDISENEIWVGNPAKFLRKT
jgi:sugar O-acyltransferase (sialic acid O-acetyltransferase NeuD family)